jgi:hypothetical protein
VLPVVDMPGMPPARPGHAGRGGRRLDPGKAFAPRDLVVLIGQRVTWRNEDTSTHDVVSRSGGFESGFLSPGASYAFTPSVGGEFPYVCSIHPQMQGRLRVYGLPLEAVPARAPAGRPCCAASRPASGPRSCCPGSVAATGSA